MLSQFVSDTQTMMPLLYSKNEDSHSIRTFRIPMQYKRELKQNFSLTGKPVQNVCRLERISKVHKHPLQNPQLFAITTIFCCIHFFSYNNLFNCQVHCQCQDFNALPKPIFPFSIHSLSVICS